MLVLLDKAGLFSPTVFARAIGELIGHGFHSLSFLHSRLTVCTAGVLNQVNDDHCHIIGADAVHLSHLVKSVRTNIVQ